jgi:multimeric flavodoxin WrbA
MTKVLGLLGSPRDGGNTDMLLDQALAGAADAGAETTKLKLGELRISGCIECNDCYAAGECSTDDDMSLVYEAIEAADRFIIASPIFFMGLPAQLKAAIDRCQRYWALKYVLKEDFPRRPGAMKRYGSYIGVGGTRGKTLFDGTILTLKYFFDAIAVTPVEDSYLLVRGIDEKGEIADSADSIEGAYKLGALLATME